MHLKDAMQFLPKSLKVWYTYSLKSLQDPYTEWLKISQRSLQALSTTKDCSKFYCINVIVLSMCLQIA